MIPEKSKPLGSNARIRELLIIVGITVLATIIFFSFGSYHLIHSFFSNVENWRVEELILSAFVLSIGLVWFSFRRWKEVDRENAVRRAAEAALKESERKYRDLVEDISEVIYATDSEGTLTYISPAVKQLLDRRPSEVIGHSFNEFFHAEDLPQVRKRFLQIMNYKAEFGPSEYRTVTKNGKIRWVQASSKPFYEGERIVGVKGMLSDINERKLAEEALRESEEKYRLLIENSNDAIFVAQDGVLKFFNPRALQMIGLSAGIWLRPDSWK